MIKIEEENKGNYWYVFLVIGLLLGAILGYYASQKGWLGSEAVGRRAEIPGCFNACQTLDGNPPDGTKYNGKDCRQGCDCIGSGGSYNSCWGFD